MKILIIGLGSMGKRRLRLLQALRKDALIVGVDERKERRFQVMEAFGIICYETVAEAAGSCSFECAFVCSSPLSHGDLIHKCLQYGWHVFTEINLVSHRYEENIKLAEERKLCLFLSSTPIYRDEMRQVDRLVKESGQPVNYIYHVGQYLPDWHPWEGIHDYFVKDIQTNGCREIMAIELPWMIKAFGRIQEISVLTGKMSELDIDYADNYLISSMHESGSKGVFAVDVLCRQPIRRLEVFNEHLYLQWNGVPNTLLYKNIATGDMETVDCGSYVHSGGYGEFINELAYVNELQEFFAVMSGEHQACYGFKEDKELLNWIDKIEGEVE